MGAIFTLNRSNIKVALVINLFLAALLLYAGPLTAASAAPVDSSPGGDASLQAEKAVFTDLSANSPLYPYVRYLTDKGIIKGFPDGSFRPADDVTRAQAARVMVLAKGLQPVKDGAATFSDVPADHWAYGEIEAAIRAGLFRGYPDGTFNPDSTITRAEAITLLLNLSGGALSGKDMVIGDVGPDHWAYRQVVTAVEAGLVELSAEKLFQPDLAFRRGDLTRGLSAMFTLSPVLRPADLTGKLVVKKGKVTVASINGVPREVSGEMRVGAGDKIKTGAGSQAEIVFDDGSGFLIEAGTDLEINQARGFVYMRENGTPGVAVDKLVVNLTKGQIFGALASRYEKAPQPAGGNKTASLGGIDGIDMVLASTELPPDLAGILLAEAEADGSENQEVPWWAEPYTERERVTVDMPWGVAGIRGTFWMNSVSATGQSSTALIIGHAVVTSGGQTVPVTAGQSTVITSVSAPPAPPAALTQSQQQALATVRDWVTQRAQDIQNNLPPAPAPAVLPPTAPVGQPPVPVQQQQQQVPDIVSTVTQSLNQATGGVTPPSNNNNGGGSTAPKVESVSAVDYTVTVTFNKEVTDAYIDKSEAWFPVVTLADGTKYKIWMEDSNGYYSACLHSVKYVAGTKNVEIFAYGAESEEEYTVTIYKGAEFDEVVMTNNTTFTYSGSPLVTQAAAISHTTIEVVFDKEVYSPIASDFSFDNDLTVLSAELKSGTDNVVVLTTSKQTENAEYVLSYKGKYAGLIDGYDTLITVLPLYGTDYDPFDDTLTFWLMDESNDTIAFSATDDTEYYDETPGDSVMKAVDECFIDGDECNEIDVENVLNEKELMVEIHLEPNGDIEEFHILKDVTQDEDPDNDPYSLVADSNGRNIYINNSWYALSDDAALFVRDDSGDYYSITWDFMQDTGEFDGYAYVDFDDLVKCVVSVDPLIHKPDRGIVLSKDLVDDEYTLTLMVNDEVKTFEVDDDTVVSVVYQDDNEGDVMSEPYDLSYINSGDIVEFTLYYDLEIDWITELGPFSTTVSGETYDRWKVNNVDGNDLFLELLPHKGDAAGFTLDFAYEKDVNLSDDEDPEDRSFIFDYSDSGIAPESTMFDDVNPGDIVQIFMFDPEHDYADKVQFVKIVDQ